MKFVNNVNNVNNELNEAKQMFGLGVFNQLPKKGRRGLKICQSIFVEG